ncbi:MAG: hicB [Ignavibacteria bacterium]|nr:hicB [Ignavibacteria bacterium]
MKDKLKYKDFIGSVHFNADDNVFYGKIEGIESLISFEGSTVTELKESFEEAVNDYLEICEQRRIKPFKSFNGSFNIRISPELHRKISEKSYIMGLPINKIIQHAIEREVGME